MSSKKWQRPKLVILVRGKPEEAILDTCKNATGEGDEKLGSECVPEFPPGACSPTVGLYGT